MPSVVSSPEAFNNVRSVEIPGVKTIIKKTPIFHIYISPNTSRISYIECFTASHACSAGRKSLTATSLFSFFLSSNRQKKSKSKVNKHLHAQSNIKAKVAQVAN